MPDAGRRFLRVEERDGAPRERHRALGGRHVPAARQDLETGIRQAAHEAVARRERKNAVAVSPDDERLVRNSREITRLHRVLPRRHGRDELHELRPVPSSPLVECRRESDERMPENARIHARRQEAPRVCVAARDEGQRRREHVDGLFDRLPRGVDEDEPPDEARVTAHHVERHGAAERMAEQIHALGPVWQRFDRVDDGVREQANPVFDTGASRLVASAVAEKVHRDDTPPPGEKRQREGPLAMVRPDSVQEDERRRTGGTGRADVEAADMEAGWKRETAELHDEKLVLPHEPDDDSLYFEVALRDPDRRHALVRGLEPDAAVRLAVEALERGLAVQEGGHHFAVRSLLAPVHDDEVAVVDAVVDHRAAVHAQDVVLSLAREHVGDGDRLTLGLGLDGLPGGDAPRQRDLDRPGGLVLLGQDQRAPLVPIAYEHALLEEQLDVLLEGAERGVPELLADLALRGREAPLLPVGPNEVQYFFLLRSERQRHKK